jgi:hypothetical protein
MTLAILTVFAGYAVATYGWVLIEGYNITLREWMSPINPWLWTSTAKVPSGHLFPVASAS